MTTIQDVYQQFFKNIEEQENEIIRVMEEWLTSQGYTGERAYLDWKIRGNQIEVYMLKPYGLFIIDLNSGTIEDNYGTLSDT